MVFCDIASFFSPRGGGVATYHRAKQNYFARHPAHRYVMILSLIHISEPTRPY